jgi:hypothetical protein
MIVMGAICVLAALIAVVFVADGRPPSPKVAPHAETTAALSRFKTRPPRDPASI